MKSLAQFLQDDSTRRFSALRLVLLVWAFGTLTTWSYLSVKNEKVEDLPPAVQVVLVTLMAGKVAQKFGENSETKGDQGEQHQPSEAEQSAVSLNGKEPAEGSHTDKVGEMENALTTSKNGRGGEHSNSQI
jgi:hypothetical protein